MICINAVCKLNPHPARRLRHERFTPELNVIESSPQRIAGCRDCRVWQEKKEKYCLASANVTPSADDRTCGRGRKERAAAAPTITAALTAAFDATDTTLSATLLMQ